MNLWSTWLTWLMSNASRKFEVLTEELKSSVLKSVEEQSKGHCNRK